jgi:hypothetical protein
MEAGTTDKSSALLVYQFYNLSINVSVFSKLSKLLMLNIFIACF